MANRLHLVCFQTMAGSAAAQITEYRFRQMTGRHRQTMTMVNGAECWYSHERRMPEREAYRTALDYARLWDEQGRPTTGDLRRAIEEGKAALWIDET